MCALVSVFLCALCLLSSTLIVNSRPSHGCTFFKSYLFYRIVCSQCVTNSMNFERSVFKFQSLPNCICILFCFLHRIRIFGKWNVRLDGKCSPTNNISNNKISLSICIYVCVYRSQSHFASSVCAYISARSRAMSAATRERTIKRKFSAVDAVIVRRLRVTRVERVRERDNDSEQHHQNNKTKIKRNWSGDNIERVYNFKSSN